MKKIIKFLLVFLLMFGIGTVTSHASISTESKSVNSGENVTISVNSNIALGAYTVSVTDNGGLTFVTSTGQEGSGKTIISGSSTSGVTNLATFTFKTPTVTEDKSYSITISATGMETPDLEGVPNSKTTAKITVKAPDKPADNGEANSNNSNNNSSDNSNQTNSSPSKSNNANLSNLIVSPVDFKGFKASKTSGYSVTIENNVTEVGIKATTQDSKAKVEVSGNKNLKVGENTVNILVTAEDGTQKTYKVTVNRKKESNNTENKEEQVSQPTAEPTPEEIENKNEEKKDEVQGITLLKLTGIAKNDVTIEPNIVPEFKTDIYEYKVTVPVDIESLEIEAKSNIPNANIEIMGNKNLVIGENIITILVKAPEGEQKTYQIAVTKTEESLNIDNNTQLIKNIIIGTIIVILVIAFIISISIFRSGRRNEKKDTLSSNINFTDEMLGKDENKSELKEKYLNGYENEVENSVERKKNGKRFK